MGRTRKVDRDTARQSALSAFWVNGYKELGVRKLEELTGINRFALQTEYGGKDGLFLEIAELYFSLWNETYREQLCQGNLQDVAAYFLQRARKSQRTEMNKGCLIFNTLGDGQPDAPAIRDVISRFLATIQDSFAAALRNERAQGTLIEELNIDEASQMLLNTLIGMNLLIRMKGRNEAALPTALGVQKTVLAWRVPT